MSGYYGSGASFRKEKRREEIDPMSSMSNVGDIMLVFACGLMVALVVAWNVDLGQFTQVEMDQEVAQEDIAEITEQLYGEGNAFVEKGTVYQDPTTGKYYLVEGGSDSSGGAAAPVEQPSGTEANGDGGASGESGE